MNLFSRNVDVWLLFLVIGWTSLGGSSHIMAAAVEEEEAFCLPDDFLVGTATAAYQVEGGWNLTNRGMSIWDEFCRESGRPNVQCANVADDMLHRYSEDIRRMKQDMNLQSFRLSISWSRVMSWNADTQSMEANAEGLKFYKDMLQELREHNIVPILTMYHWDLPLDLHNHVGGWLSKDIVPHFVAYAELLYQQFGSLVHYWSTFNEPWTFTLLGYDVAAHAPGITDNAYLAAHNVLLSHAAAVEAFRRSSYIDHDNSKISMVLNCDYGFALDPTNNPTDVEMVERKMVFTLGWFLHPLLYGDYPALMKNKEYALPEFTEEESEMLRGSLDLFMLNHYSSTLITSCDGPNSTISCDELPSGWYRDLGIDNSRFPENARLSSTNAKGERNCGWFSGVPEGYLQVIRWMHSQDTSMDILLTENGWCGNATIDNYDQLWYYQSYLHQVYHAITEEKIPIIGYTAWSLLDNYEWGSFEPRFGLYYVEYPAETGSKDGYKPTPSELKRVPRPSAHYIAHVAQTKCINTFSTKNSHTIASGGTRWWEQKSIVFLFVLGVFLSTLYLFCVEKKQAQYSVIPP